MCWRNADLEVYPNLPHSPRDKKPPSQGFGDTGGSQVPAAPTKPVGAYRPPRSTGSFAAKMAASKVETGARKLDRNVYTPTKNGTARIPGMKAEPVKTGGSKNRSAKARKKKAWRKPKLGRLSKKPHKKPYKLLPVHPNRYRI